MGAETSKAENHLVEADSEYFTANAGSGAPINTTELLNSYGGNYIKYLSDVADQFTGEQTVTGRLIASTNAYGVRTARTLMRVPVEFKIDLGATQVNKMLNKLAQEGRLHKDHGFYVEITGAVVPDDKFEEIKEKALAAFQERLQAARDAGKGTEKDTEPTPENVRISNRVSKLIMRKREWVIGLGLVGTHSTEIEVEIGDVASSAFDTYSVDGQAADSEPEPEEEAPTLPAQEAPAPAPVEEETPAPAEEEAAAPAEEEAAAPAEEEAAAPAEEEAAAPAEEEAAAE